MIAGYPVGESGNIRVRISSTESTRETLAIESMGDTAATKSTGDVPLIDSTGYTSTIDWPRDTLVIDSAEGYRHHCGFSSCRRNA